MHQGTEQQVEAKPLAPNQRRGHVRWLDASSTSSAASDRF